MLRQIVSRLGSHVVLLVGATLLLYFGVAIVGRTVQMYELQQEEARLERKLVTLEARRQELLRLKAAVSSNAHVEQVAREQLGLVKPGEIGVIVLTPPASAEEAVPAPEAKPDTRANWERWHDWLVGR